MDSRRTRRALIGAAATLSAGIATAQEPTLEEALDVNGLGLVFEVDDDRDGNPAWFGQTAASFDGTDAAQVVTDGQGITHAMTTMLTGPVKLRFQVEFFTDPGDAFFEVLVDDDLRLTLDDRSNGWLEQLVGIGDGEHAVTWRYRKPLSFRSGQFVRIDALELLAPGEGPPAFVAMPPARIDRFAGDDLELSAEAIGADSFQWFKDEGEIPGATDGVLALTGLTPADSGSYLVVASSGEGSTASRPADVRVWEPAEIPSVIDLPEVDPTVVRLEGDGRWMPTRERSAAGGSSMRSPPLGHGEHADLCVNVEGPARVQFAWRVSSERWSDVLELLVDGVVADSTSGPPRSTAFTTRAVVIAPGTHELCWRYRKDSANSHHEDTAWVDNLRVTPGEGTAPPAIAVEPWSTSVSPGDAFDLSVRLASGAAQPIAIEWFHDGAPVDGATGLTLPFPRAEATRHDGAYTARITNANGSVETRPAVVTVEVGPFSGLVEVHRPPTTNDLNCVVVLPDDAILAFGDGVMLASTDAGATWAPSNPFFGRRINDAAVADDGTVAVVGDDGFFAMSDDGGASWLWEPLSTPADFDAVVCLESASPGAGESWYAAGEESLVIEVEETESGPVVSKIDVPIAEPCDFVAGARIGNRVGFLGLCEQGAILIRCGEGEAGFECTVRELPDPMGNSSDSYVDLGSDGESWYTNDDADYVEITGAADEVIARGSGLPEGICSWTAAGGGDAIWWTATCDGGVHRSFSGPGGPFELVLAPDGDRINDLVLGDDFIIGVGEDGKIVGGAADASAMDWLVDRLEPAIDATRDDGRLYLLTSDHLLGPAGTALELPEGFSDAPPPSSGLVAVGSDPPTLLVHNGILIWHLTPSEGSVSSDDLLPSLFQDEVPVDTAIMAADPPELAILTSDQRILFGPVDGAGWHPAALDPNGLGDAFGAIESVDVLGGRLFVWNDEGSVAEIAESDGEPGLVPLSTPADFEEPVDGVRGFAVSPDDTIVGVTRFGQWVCWRDGAWEDCEDRMNGVYASVVDEVIWHEALQKFVAITFAGEFFCIGEDAEAVAQFISGEAGLDLDSIAVDRDGVVFRTTIGGVVVNSLGPPGFGELAGLTLAEAVTRLSGEPTMPPHEVCEVYDDIVPLGTVVDWRWDGSGVKLWVSIGPVPMPTVSVGRRTLSPENPATLVRAIGETVDLWVPDRWANSLDPDGEPSPRLTVRVDGGAGIERTFPFGGTSINVGELEPGLHTITVTVALDDAGVQTTESTFEVLVTTPIAIESLPGEEGLVQIDWTRDTPGVRWTLECWDSESGEWLHLDKVTPPYVVAPVGGEPAGEKGQYRLRGTSTP